jgi:nitrate reductase gamma subunit
MDLLEFARGPALQVAAYILVAGVIWRLVGIIFLKEKPEFSEPRKPGGLLAALKVIYTRSFTAHPFKRATLYPKMLAYVLHIGFFAVIFLLVVAGIALLVRRLTNPVLKLISNFDDYFSWFVTLLPIVTGLIMPVRMGVRYETLLAIHILSVAVLMIWLPFGKLGHTFLVFVTRGTTGMVFERRGAKT